MSTSEDLPQQYSDLPIDVNVVAGTITATITGMSTEAKQDVGNASLASIDTKLTSPLTIGLPTGASTSALQTSGNTFLSSIDTKIPSLGQALAAASVPVVLTAAQLTTLTPLSTVAVTQSTSPWVVSAASLPLPTGASTAALQTTGNASLSSIDGKLPALGQALAAASVPVVLTAAQLATLTPLSSVTVTKTALTASAQTAVNIGITSTAAVASNASRKGLVLTNTSVNTISLGIGTAAVLNQGITLYPGGVWQMDDGTFVTGAINAVASLGASVLAIQEFT